MSLQIHLAQVPDHHQPGGNLRRKLLNILVVSVLAVLNGADIFVATACFAERKLPVLRRYLNLAHGPPAHDTFRRVFQHLDAARFKAAFLGRMRQLLPAAVAEQVCIEGKTLRGSGPQPLHLVMALVRAEGLCLAQVAGMGKGQELGARLNVLALMDLSAEALVSLDALVASRRLPGKSLSRAATTCWHSSTTNAACGPRWSGPSPGSRLVTKPGIGPPATYPCAGA